MSELVKQMKSYQASPHKQAKADAQAAPTGAPATDAPKATPASPIAAAAAKAAEVPAPPAAPATTPGFHLPTELSAPPSVPVAQAAPEAAAPSAPPAPTPTPETKPLLTYDGKSFSSMEEIVGYMAELKGKTSVLERQAQPAAPVTPAEPEVKLEELMFEDPARYNALVQEAAVRRVQAEFERRDAQVRHTQTVERTWDRFYTSNPRLKDYKEIVQMKVNEVIAEKGETFDMDAGLKLAADRALTYLDGLRDRLTPAASETILPNSPAHTTSATPATVVSAPAVRQRKTLTDQIRSLQHRGAKH